jgi:hypothetical protein
VQMSLVLIAPHDQITKLLLVANTLYNQESY